MWVVLDYGTLWQGAGVCLYREKNVHINRVQMNWSKLLELQDFKKNSSYLQSQSSKGFVVTCNIRKRVER